MAGKWIEFQGFRYQPRNVIESLQDYVTQARKARIAEVLSKRLRHIHVVVENLFDAGNLFAVLRSVEALGFVYVHVVEEGIGKQKLPNRSSLRAEKWVEILRWKTALECADFLKKEGIAIATTDFSATQHLHELDLKRPTAFVLGNEHDGLTKRWDRAKDFSFQIRMQGFMQSFNISVAAALCLYEARIQNGEQGNFSESDIEYWTALCYSKSVSSAHQLLQAKNQPRSL